MSGGILASLLSEETMPEPPALVGEEGVGVARSPLSRTQPSEFKVKNKKNAKAAADARAQGGRTRTEIAAEEAILAAQANTQKQQKLMKELQAKDKIVKIADKVGNDPNANTPEAYMRVKNMMPGLTEEAYFNGFLPNAQKRASLTAQLSRLPIGTPLPEATVQKLAQYGITDPNEYMSVSVTGGGKGIIGQIAGTVRQTAAGMARQGAQGVVGGFGRAVAQQEDAIIRGIEEAAAAESRAAASKLQALSQGIKEDTLDRKQQFSAIRDIKNDLLKESKNAETLNQWFNNVREFSDPAKTSATLRLEDNFGQLTGKGDPVITKKSFQNINDIGLVYSLIKMLDPGSVVREGEIKLADKSLGLLDSLGVRANNVFKGETLSPQQRAGILNIANKTFISGTRSLRDNIQTAEQTADEFGLQKNLSIPKSVRTIANNAEVAEKALTEFEQTQSPQEQAQEEPGQFRTEEAARAAGAKSGDVVMMFNPATGRFQKARLN